MADGAAKVVTENGLTVLNVNVSNRPGQHPAQPTVDAVMALMGALSVLVVFLSIFLVTNTIALMAQQIRQIGVMKALGATFSQVTGVYLGLVLAFGTLALLIAIPLTALASYGYDALDDHHAQCQSLAFQPPS
jgi:putative ABC transport system permease protein